MIDREAINRKMQEHYHEVWKGDDPWDFECSDFEQARYERQIEILAGRCYGRVLEIGCGAGRFSRLLAPLAEQVVALDIAPAAIEKARAAGDGAGSIDFRVANIMDYDPHAEGPWDLVVMSETIYSLGWLYPLFDVGWLIAQLFDSLREGGLFLLANTYGGETDFLLLPWLINTYRDLFLNVGYRLEAEEIFRGTKDGVDMEVLISLFFKPSGRGPVNE